MDDVELSVDGAVAVITINRPHVLNAFRQQTFAELRAALSGAADDPGVRVVVLTGRGRAFSAGEDLSETADQFADKSDAELASVLADLQDLTRQVMNHPKIVVAAVNGIAVGFGAELAIACDARIAAQSAEFAFMEVRRGLYPTNGVLYLLPRLIGHGRALDLFLTGDRMDAPTAYGAGLVSRVVPDAELEAAVLKWADTVAAGAPIPVRLLKQHVRRTWDSDLETMMELETRGIISCIRSEDMSEGVAAFAQRRSPNFRGR